MFWLMARKPVGGGAAASAIASIADGLKVTFPYAK
jgi:hypothetical protein